MGYAGYRHLLLFSRAVLVENLVWLVWLHAQFYLNRHRREGDPAEWRVTDEEMTSLAKLTRKHTASLGDLVKLKVGSCFVVSE
jgi:hypothetical protein